MSNLAPPLKPNRFEANVAHGRLLVFEKQTSVLTMPAAVVDIADVRFWDLAAEIEPGGVYVRDYPRGGSPDATGQKETVRERAITISF